jgi:2-aminoethylphosphonate-pyruvate transaminase
MPSATPFSTSVGASIGPAGFRRSFHLLCPGPVNVDPRVAQALTAFAFGHREEEFEALLDVLRERIVQVATLDPKRYTSVVLTGSGTAANESVLASAPGLGRAVVVLTNGEFGERLARISTVHNPGTVVVEHAWAQPLDLAKVEETLAIHRPSLVAMVHHETSSGLLNPVAAVGALARKYGAQLFVDGVSSFSADPIDLDAAGVTFMSTSSGKAIGSFPGLSMVIGTHEAFRGLGHRPTRSHYLDLHRFYEFAEIHRQTPNTPAVPLMLALNEALGLALEEGVRERMQRLQGLAHRVRARARELGLATLLEASVPQSSVLTSILLPDDVDFEAFRQALRVHGFVIYGGKGPFSGKMFQVSTIGEVDGDLIDAFFEVVREAIAECRVGRRSVA